MWVEYQEVQLTCLAHRHRDQRLVRPIQPLARGCRCEGPPRFPLPEPRKREGSSKRKVEKKREVGKWIWKEEKEYLGCAVLGIHVPEGFKCGSSS